MSSLVFFKLLAIFVIVAIGWIVGKLRWLSPADAETGATADPARVLSNAAYYIFVPALLFRTTARIDFKSMPWDTLIAVFVPAAFVPIRLPCTTVRNPGPVGTGSGSGSTGGSAVDRAAGAGAPRPGEQAASASVTVESVPARRSARPAPRTARCG